uniref:Uncharacterized protein n=1 Tax=viral metagenome TaxID=1070528 RepID=A0A6H1ZFA6_9ZZZZ
MSIVDFCGWEMGAIQHEQTTENIAVGAPVADSSRHGSGEFVAAVDVNDSSLSRNLNFADAYCWSSFHFNGVSGGLVDDWNIIARYAVTGGTVYRKIAFKATTVNTVTWAVLDGANAVLVQGSLDYGFVNAHLSRNHWIGFICKRTETTKVVLRIVAWDWVSEAALKDKPDSGRIPHRFLTLISTGDAVHANNWDTWEICSLTSGKGATLAWQCDDAFFGSGQDIPRRYPGVLHTEANANVGAPYNDWEALAGGADSGDWNQWDEIPADDATSYNRSPLAGDQQLSDLGDRASIIDYRGGYALDDQTSPGLRRSLLALGMRLRCSYVADGVNTIDLLYRFGSGAPTNGGTLPAVGAWTSYDFMKILEAGSTYKNKDVDDWEMGAEASGAGVAERRVTTLGAEIAYIKTDPWPALAM